MNCLSLRRPLAVVLVVSLANTLSAEAPRAAEVTVELLDAGSMPRKELRFRPQKGAKQQSVMTLKMKQSVAMNGAPAPAIPMPAQKITMELSIDDVSKDGDISLSFKFLDIAIVDDPDNPSPVAASIQTMLKPMIGATGRSVMTNRGLTQKSEFDVPEGLSPQIKSMLDGMKDSMNRLSSPLPVEPIGLGGKWKVIQRLTANGLELNQISVHELTEMANDHFAMKLDVSQEAPPQRMKNPMLPESIVVMLDSLVSSGSGKSTVSNTSAFPLSVQLKSQTALDANMSVGDQKQKMSTKLDIDVDLSPVSP